MQKTLLFFEGDSYVCANRLFSYAYMPLCGFGSLRLRQILKAMMSKTLFVCFIQRFQKEEEMRQWENHVAAACEHCDIVNRHPLFFNESITR